MNIKEKIIEFKNSTIDSIVSKLEKRKEIRELNTNGYIDVSKLSPKERENAFKMFAEGNKDLYTLLTVAYENGIQSMFSCAGHSENYFGYIVFKVNDDNLEKIRKVGKVISHYGIATNFQDHYKFGKRVSFEPHRDIVKNRSWFAKMAETIKDTPQYDVEPTIFYHEEMYISEAPFSERLEEKIINVLKKLRSPEQKLLVETKEQKNTNKLGEKLREEYKSNEEKREPIYEPKENVESVDDNSR